MTEAPEKASSIIQHSVNEHGVNQPGVKQQSDSDIAHPHISLCLIVKNEEQFLARCLASVQSVVSEIILVDTGSSDRTLEIAESFSARIFKHPWREDFAAARNLSLQYARGDWILVLDADEEIASEDLPTLLTHTEDPSVCWEFYQRHYTDDIRLSNFQPCRGEFPSLEAGQQGFFESKLVRFFPNYQGIHYQGRVHELLEQSISAIGKHRIATSPLRIHHWGHSSKVERSKSKADIYTPLGERKIEERPQDWKGFFELGVEHNNNRRYLESEKAFLKSLELNPAYIASWINLGFVQCELRNYQAATNSLNQALRLEPDNTEALCNLAVVQMRSGAYQRAEQVLRTTISIDPGYMNAYSNLGVLLAQLGRLAESALMFCRMLEFMPTNSEARERIRTIYSALGREQEAERLLARFIS